MEHINKILSPETFSVLTVPQNMCSEQHDCGVAHFIVFIMCDYIETAFILVEFRSLHPACSNRTKRFYYTH